MKFTKTPKDILAARRATENAVHFGFRYEVSAKNERGEHLTAFCKRFPSATAKLPGVSVWDIVDNCIATRR